MYTARWLNECIAKGRIVSPDDYILITNTNSELARKLNIGKKKKYTIMEGMKLYEMITNQRNSQVGTNQFWMKIVSN